MMEKKGSGKCGGVGRQGIAGGFPETPVHTSQ